jgi:hypothetical protein
MLDRGKFPNEIIEIKPIGLERMKGYDIVLMKERAGIEYANKNGLVYKIVKTPCLKKHKIIFPMRQKYDISLNGRWEDQYWNWVFENPVVI